MVSAADFYVMKCLSVQIDQHDEIGCFPDVSLSVQTVTRIKIEKS